MYRRRIEKKFLTTAASANASRPVPVYQSQQKTQNEVNEKENEDEVIQSSQQNEDESRTQSRFKSQRAILVQSTQQELRKGKGYLEVTLLNCRMEFTEMGCELIDGKDDPLSFTRRFRTFMSSKKDAAQSKDDYLKEFKKDFVLTDNLKKDKCIHLMRGIFIKDGEQKYQTQTTLIMCLLAIDCFKNELPKILIIRLKEYVIEKGDDADKIIIGLVLMQFKFSEQFLDDETYDFMFEELFEILSHCKKFECRDVIVQHFRELSLPKQEEAARRLYIMYETNKTELLKFIDTFCDMTLDTSLAEQVFIVIQQYIEKDCSVQHYPAMLKYSQFYASSNIEIVDMLRERIKWESCTKDIIDEMFKLIDKSIKRDNSKLIESWLTVISEVRNNEELRLIDFIILISIADTNTEAHQRNVKKILLDQISKGLFPENHLKKSFKVFSKIIVENSQTLLEMLDGLQKTRENQQMYNFLATCYKLIFRYSNEVKPIIGSLVNFLCEKKAALPFSSASEFKVTILNIFNDIKNDKVTSAGSLLINYKLLLRVLDLWKTELSFNEHRLYVEFLCSLVYKIDYSKGFKKVQLTSLNESKDALRDHLNMLVVKHINNPDERIKQLGIIGAVKIVSALVVDTLCESEFTENQTINIDDMPRGPVKDAADLVDLMMSAANEDQEILSMLFDELSFEFKPTQNESMINQMFLGWLGAITLTKLEDLVTISVDLDLPEYDGIKLDNKFEIIDEQYEKSELGIKLGVLVFEKSKDIIIVPSLFKLTRCINFQRFGNVDFMAGLVSMPLSLPEKFGSEDDFLVDDAELAKLQLDLYFHTCNWLREIIGGFLQSSDDIFVKQVMKKRLMQLIMIEKQLDNLLQNAPPNYLPPFLNFLQNEHKKKMFEGLSKNKEKKASTKPPPAKKGKKKKNETIIQDIEAPEGHKNVNLIKSSQFCREMDNDVALLLNEEFKLSMSQSVDTDFTLTELIYLLDDVYDKFMAIFKAHKVDAKGFTDEIKNIRDIKAHIMPYLVRIFRNINKEIGNVSSNSMESDDDDEAALFTAEGILIKKSFHMILKIFDILFSSKKLKLDDNCEVLTDMLKQLIENSTSHFRSQELLCTAIIEQFMDYEKNAKEIGGAVALIDFMTTINSFKKDRMNSVKICELSERLLRTRWKNSSRQLEHGSALNSCIEKLLKIYVKKATDLESIEKLVENIEEITNKNELVANKVFPCITKANLIYMLRIYIQRYSEIINSTKSANMTFEFWKTCTKLEEKFLSIVKWIKSMVAFNLFLKNFIVYLKKLNSDGMNILNEAARKDTQRFVQLVKDIQKIRRNAHGVACELKHRKNNSISAILPTARQQFETFYHAAGKIAKQANITNDHLSVGTLRNFDVDGEDIFSQNTTAINTQNGSVLEQSDNEDEEAEKSDVDMTPDLSDIETSEDSDDETGNKKKRSKKDMQSSMRSRSTIL
ncbi:hypothetical protein ACKWTF_003556 [Chironomus riparius]